MCARAFLALLLGATALVSLDSASAGVLDRVKQEQTIRIAVRSDAPPFSFKGPNGEASGFMVDLCNAVATDIAEELALDRLAVDFVPVTAENRFETIQTGKADLLCEPTTETLERRKNVDFSIPTFVDGASLLVKGDGPKELAELAGKKVGVLGGTTTEQLLRNTLDGAGIKADVVAAKSHDDGLKMLDAGEVAAYFADRAILAYLASSAKDNDQLKLATAYLSVEPYALALPRGDEDFRLAVDAALSRIYSSGDIAQIFARTFGPQMQPSDTLKTLYLLSAIPE